MQRWVVIPLRAGALAAGGSLLTLVLTAVLARLVEPKLPLVWSWLALTLVSFALALRFGHRDPARGIGEIGLRLLGTTVYGGLLVLAVLVPVLYFLPAASGVPVALVILAGCGALFIVLARRSLRETQLVEVPDTPGLIPAAPPVEHAARYELVPSTAPLSAEEHEREAPAIEVRVLWGTDLLHVHHLSPPRPLHLGDDPVGLAPPGSGRFPLIEVEGDRVFVSTPPSATRVVQAGGEEGSRLLLSPGMKVSISLPTTAAKDAYRAAPGAERAEGVVLEISHVRAGRVVGRSLSLSLRAAERPLGFLLLSSVLVLGYLGLSAFFQPVRFPDDDEFVDSTRQQEIQRQMEAVRLRLAEDSEPDEIANPEHRTIGEGRVGRDGHVHHDVPYRYADIAEGRAFAPIPELGFMHWMAMCSEHLGTFEERQFGDDYKVVCPLPALTPFGLRDLGLPSARDAFHRDPSDPWPAQLAEARRWTRPRQPRVEAPSPHAEIASLEIEGGVSRAPFARAVRARLADLRACHALGLEEDPRFTLRISLRFSVGVDGLAHAPGPFAIGSAPLVGSCVRRALEGMRVEAPSRPGTARVVIALYPKGR